MSSVLVSVSNDDGETVVVQMDETDAYRLRAIVRDCEDWPSEANDILARATPLKLFGSVSTAGDGFGWFDP